MTKIHKFKFEPV